MRVNLLRAHGSPTHYLYRRKGCRCVACRAAHNEYTRRYREAHPEQARERHRRYYEAHREEDREQRRRYREGHPEEMKERDRRYRDAHGEQVKDRHRRRRGNLAAAKAIARHDGWEVVMQYARQKGRCAVCKKVLDMDDGHTHRDHITPVSLNGSDGMANLRLLCRRCNESKGDKPPMDFGMLF